jgi:hypothetical protein
VAVDRPDATARLWIVANVTVATSSVPVDAMVAGMGVMPVVKVGAMDGGTACATVP